MVNLVEVTVRVNSDKAALDEIAKSFGDAGGKSGDNFNKGLNDKIGKAAIGGALGALAPFAGEAMSGLLVGGLGVALTAMAVYGASKNKDVVKSFDDLKTSANKDITEIGAPFVPVLQSMFTSAQSAMGKLTPVFTGAVQTISKPVQTFGDTLIKAFTQPAVTKSIQDIAKAFGDMLNNLSPQLPGMVKQIAGAISQVADAFSGKAFANIVQFFVDIATDVLIVVANLGKLLGIIPPSLLSALAAGFLGIYTAVKLWSGVQAVLDALMDANPFVLVALAVVALAAGFYEAWEHSSSFRDVIKDIGGIAVGIAIVAVGAFKDVTDSFLDMAGTIIDGAAKAFGWVPGLGPKLKDAAKTFDGFKSGVNNDFNGMIGTLKDWQKGLDASGTTTAAITKQIAGDFTNQSKAVSDAKNDINLLDVAISSNGSTSDAAKKARQQLITDMVNAGLNSKTAKTDVDNYSSAVAKNGTDSTQAQKARQQLITDLLGASKNAKQGKTDLDNYTNSVKTNGSDSSTTQKDRAQLIKDLENAGLSAQAAKKLVDQLTTSIKDVPANKTVNLKAVAYGSGKVEYKESFPGGSLQGSLLYGATGMRVPGAGNEDSVLAMLMPGEAVVPKRLVPQIAGWLGDQGVPGFASGGLIGNMNGPSDAMGKIAGSYMQRVDDAANTKMYAILQQKMGAALAAAEKAAAAKSAGVGASDIIGIGGLTAAGGSVEALMKTAAASIGWTGAQWTALYDVEEREAGFNLTAKNPSSGAYGLAQFINGPSEYAQYGGNSFTAAGQIVAMLNYIKQRYGTPEAAWAHEESYGWYGSGGPASGWIGVGDRGRELIKVPNGSTVYPNGASEQMMGGGGNVNVSFELGSSGNSEFDNFMLKWVREQVRVKGGGSVQKALGRN